jgi:TusA-related sulfurtransferase
MLRPAAVTVDGTLLTCKGVIARLEKEFYGLPSGSLVRVFVNEVPNWIDVRAWADRKGHRVVDEERRGETFELVLAKSGLQVSPAAPGAARSSR